MTRITILVLGITTLSFSSAFAYSDVTIPLGASIQTNPFSLSPSVVNVKTNETVVWYNQDNTIHSVTTGTTQYGFDGRFDSGPIQPGQSFSYTFTKSGVYQYFCIFHPWMTGVVNVGIGGQIEPIYEITFSTDKSAYNTGDNILVSGQVSKFIPNEIITIWVTDSQGKGIVENHIETENGTKFQTSITAGEHLWTPGNTYTIFAQYGSRSDVAMSQIEFEPNSIVKPNNSQAQQIGTVQATQSLQASYPAAHKLVLADENSYLTIQTAKQIYLPGDEVKVIGSIWDGVLEKVGGPAYLVTAYSTGGSSNSISEVVTIQLKDGQGNSVSNKTVAADSNGIYSATFTLPKNTVASKYTVDAAIQTKAGLVNALDSTVYAKLGTSTSFVVSAPSSFVVKTTKGDLDVKIASNSTVNNFMFNPNRKMISFDVQGETGTKGVALITIPKIVLSGNLQVYMDGAPEQYNSDNVFITDDNSNATTLELDYHHSSHVFEIVGTQAAQPSIESVPEFSSLSTMVFAFATLSLIALTVIHNKIRIRI